MIAHEIRPKLSYHPSSEASLTESSTKQHRLYIKTTTPPQPPQTPTPHSASPQTSTAPRTQRHLLMMHLLPPTTTTPCNPHPHGPSAMMLPRVTIGNPNPTTHNSQLLSVFLRLLRIDQLPTHHFNTRSQSSIGVAIPSRIDSRIPGIDSR
jgi:hypothetical protein